MLTMWLLRTSYTATTHVVYSYYLVCNSSGSVITKTIIKDSHMHEPHKNSKLLPIKVSEAAFFLLLFRRNFLKGFLMGQKIPLVEYVIYFVLICTFCWLNVNRSTCVWHIPMKNLVTHRLLVSRQFGWTTVKVTYPKYVLISKLR